jgi:transcriptional regulator with XRE-family HTH domain
MGTALPELTELNRIRLEEDKSYESLAEEIGIGDTSTLYRLLNQPEREPQDRTLYKIRKYLDARTAPVAKRRRKA